MLHGCRENQEKELYKSDLLPKLLGTPSWGVGVEEKEGCVPSGCVCVCVGGGQCRHPASTRSHPSLTFSMCHVSITFCYPPLVHIAISSCPKGIVSFPGSEDDFSTSKRVGTSGLWLRFEIQLLFSLAELTEVQLKRLLTQLHFLTKSKEKGWDPKCLQFPIRALWPWLTRIHIRSFLE